MILVTGAGLIGQLTAAALAARGDSVLLADVRPESHDEPVRSGVTRAVCDVTDANALKRMIDGCSVTAIIHTAAMLSTGIRRDPVAGVQVNVLGTANVLEAARQAGLRRVVIASSTTVAYTVFGRHGPQPIEEDAPLHLLSERPASIYAVTKLAGEQLALVYHDLYGVDVVALRFGAVLGASPDGSAPTSVPGRLLSLIDRAARTGETLRLDDPFLLWGGREEFVDARDCARACLHALDAADPTQRVYNIASGAWFSLPEFLAAAIRVHPALKVETPPLPLTGFAGFPYQRPAPSDISAAKSELGFVCAHDLVDSIGHWRG